ncbi:hypothetical protein [Motiliproteus sp.]|uniref:hypothetical protein n=1 Tax=Motiliproteus sp. TaxID=1898955 RepID=UPI003BA86758
MTKTFVWSLLVSGLLPSLAQAEPMNLRCSYTEASYSAAYMKQPESRKCPQTRCYYDLRFDTEQTQATVNQAEGYQFSQSDEQYKLYREMENPIVEGIDKSAFLINKSDLSYRSRKSTPPDVVIETSGQCEAF